MDAMTTTRASLPHEHSTIRHEWLLKRNCSLSPRELGLWYAAICIATLAVATLSAFLGAWYVLIFSIVELGAVAVAFLHYARHATDREHIALDDGCLLVERIEAGHTQRTRLNPYWTRIIVPDRAGDLINLEAVGIKVKVGRFVTAGKRRQVARELRQELRNSAFLESHSNTRAVGNRQVRAE